MNIIIGIVGRDMEDSGTLYQVISKNNLKYLHNFASYVGILSYDNDHIDDSVLEICDGFIIPGGSDICDYHYDIVKYALDNNKPILGICLGNQVLGTLTNREKDDGLIKITGHNGRDIRHNINIKKDSFLYKVLGDRLLVNSRHNYALKKVNLPFKISASSDDGVIEGIEYIDDEHFALGLQWHIEDMNNMQNLYNLFIREVIVRKNKKNLK